MCNQGTVNPSRANDSNVQDRGGICTPALQGLTKTAHQVDSQVRNISSETTDYTRAGSHGRHGMVDINEASGGEFSTDNGTDPQHHDPNRRIPSWLGAVCQGEKTESHRSTSSYPIISKKELMSTSRKASPLADGQYRCGIYQQTGRNQVRPTHTAGPGDLETMPVSQDKSGCPIPSGFRECGGRYRITTNECQDRVYSCQTSVCEISNTLLHPRSRPVRIQAKSASTIVCGTSPRPGGNGDRCVHLGLEQMDIVHSSSDSSVEQGPSQNSSRQSNGFTNSTGMGGTAVVPVTVGHVGRLSSQTSDITEDNLSSVRPDSGSPIVEDVSSDCVASFR